MSEDRERGGEQEGRDKEKIGESKRNRGSREREGKARELRVIKVHVCFTTERKDQGRVC